MRALLLAFLACAPAPPPSSEPAAPAQVEPAEPEHAPALPAPVSLPSAPGEAGAREFVAAFLDARVKGDEPRARDFLSPTALEQYEKGEGGLAIGASGSRWELVSLNAADANSYEATVRIYEKMTGGEGSSFEEVLFVGPGPDASDTQRPWIVRGASRTGGSAGGSGA
ncbi:MAG TPA: hypothetical protein VF756_01080 [Thermoanaerobaculia bacterium]